MWCVYSGILPDHKKEWNRVICNSVNGLEGIVLGELSQRKTNPIDLLQVEPKRSELIEIETGQSDRIGRGERWVLPAAPPLPAGRLRWPKPLYLREILGPQPPQMAMWCGDDHTDTCRGLSISESSELLLFPQVAHIHLPLRQRRKASLLRGAS